MPPTFEVLKHQDTFYKASLGLLTEDESSENQFLWLAPSVAGVHDAPPAIGELLE